MLILRIKSWDIVGGIKMELIKLGWNDEWEEKFVPFENKDYSVGRVVVEHTHIYRIATKYGELQAEVSGRIRGKAEGRLGRRDEFPAIGDWVIIRKFQNEDKAIIHGILPRKSKFSRKAAGKGSHEQIVAANLDVVFILSSLNNEFNVRRIERYLTLAWESNANPIIILTKADLCSDVPSKIAEVESIAIGVPVHVISTLQGEGVEEIYPYLKKGETVGLLGSSGVGKSTLVNFLLGEDILRTNKIREGDDQGKHTTTHRELIALPNGGLIIDTPGMRELQVWEVDDGLSNLFEDIIQLSDQCRFNDCLHRNEPGCAVQEAIKQEKLHPERLHNYNKMQQEAADLSLKRLGNIQAVEKEKGKKYGQLLQDEYGRGKNRRRGRRW